MGLLERHLEQMLVNFPNLVSSDLWGRKLPIVNRFGDINVCVRQGRLRECRGRIDLAFITECTVHVVELKRRTVSVETLEQLKRYLISVQGRYPDHLTVGYLAGRACKDWPLLRAVLKDERVSTLIVGRDIPRVRELRICKNCKAGFHYRHESCPYCTAE